MKKQMKFNIGYLIIAIWGILILQSLIATWHQPLTLSYSEFQTALKEDRVKEITVTSQFINGNVIIKDKNEKLVERAFRTIIVDPRLVSQFDQYNIEYTGKIESTFLSDLFSWLLPVLVFVGIWFFLFRRIGQHAQSEFMSIGKSKARIYIQTDVKVKFSDVAGIDEAKEELQEAVSFLKEPERFTRLGGRMPKGILLVGPPGTGKTLLAKAIAGEANVPFFSLSGSDFVEMFVGVGAARVRDLFNQAKEKAPCIIFIDELDALGKARGVGMMGGHDEREQTLNQLLVEMDGFETNQAVILMAATNRPEILDPALLRAGRFDRQVLVDKPDKNGRREILLIHSRSIPLDEDVDLEKIAAMTPGFAGADLANTVNEAALLASRYERERVKHEDFVEAIERIVAGLEKKNRLINDKERNIVAYHEIGHAIVALTLPDTDPVEKISIIPRGISALGYTMQMPTEDRYLLSRTELMNRVAVLMGGRTVEELIFGDITTGAANDIARATDIVKHMITQFGMSERLGRIAYEHQANSPFMPMQTVKKDYSEETAREIDCEIRKIIDRQASLARWILEHYEAAVREAAVFLLEKETIAGKDLDEILKRHPALDLRTFEPGAHQCSSPH